MAGRSEVRHVEGREVRLTNLDKLFWQDERITKADMLQYYSDMAPVILRYLQDRPFIMRVWPDGVGGKDFYRWRVPAYAPEWLERFCYELQTARRTTEMAVVDDLPELLWVVNQGVIEMHPWIATRHAPERPTWLFFDLDPLHSDDFAQVLEVAAWIGLMLDELGLRSMPKTSGGKGLHIFVPLEPRYSFEEVRRWLGDFIAELERRHPNAVTSDKRRATRAGRVLIDYSQNALGKSIVAPYSLRAKPGAPVSTPLSWDEVRSGRVRPLEFTIRTLPRQLATRGDLFEALLGQRQRLPGLQRQRGS